ncbi:TPA: hypothetical protein N0F65_011771 [Lagenidium giganteum]|uniref:Uncharacterized protein n=1 Tax=Lagenidium giganteum TaxID=4803 RepID=A0AAV2YHJ8_9STRA|nr:TPA: hypothetical protein N0F65_011771 [Lagenidium giganteum]
MAACLAENFVGSARGKCLLSTVPGTDEYNNGVLLSKAPWDVCPAYQCKGTFDFDTYTGMRWHGQGKLLYHPRSHVYVVPVFMSKTFNGIITEAIELRYTFPYFPTQ